MIDLKIMYFTSDAVHKDIARIKNDNDNIVLNTKK